MSGSVQAWAYLFAVVGGGWALVMLLGLMATPRDYPKARALLFAFGIVSVAVATVGLSALAA